MQVRNKSIQSVILRSDLGATVVPPGEHEIPDHYRSEATDHPLIEVDREQFTEETITKLVDPSALRSPLPRPAKGKGKARADQVGEDGERVERNG